MSTPLGLSNRGLLAVSVAASIAILLSTFLHSGYSPYWIYSDVYSFWWRSWVSAGQVPYSSPAAYLEDPPVSGAVLYAARMIGGWVAGAAGGLYSGYYDSFSALSLLAAVGIAWSTWRLTKALGRQLNPLYFLLPSMIVYGVYNFDLFNAFFIVLGLQLFVEKRPSLSALSIGLAIGTKLVAVFLIPIFLLESTGWKARSRYLAISLAVAAATVVPVAVFDWGWFSWFLGYFGSWGLEDAWYIWIFWSPFSSAAKLFGDALLVVLLARVYTLKVPLVERSFLALAAYLFASYIYAPQFSLMLIPLVAVLGASSTWLLPWEVANAFIILTWFTVPATSTSGPTYPGTLPQAMALVRSLSLALLSISVASQSGHSLTGWLRARLGTKAGSAQAGTGTGHLTSRAPEESSTR